MRRMTKKIAVSVLVAVAALLLFWFVWPTPYRYMSKAPLMWRVNRFTGDVDVATAKGWQNYARMKSGQDIPESSKEVVEDSPSKTVVPTKMIEVKGPNGESVTVKIPADKQSIPFEVFKKIAAQISNGKGSRPGESARGQWVFVWDGKSNNLESQWEPEP